MSVISLLWTSGPNNFRSVSTLLVCLALARMTYAEPSLVRAEPDIYDRYAQLAESIRVWSEHGIPRALQSDSAQSLATAVSRCGEEIHEEGELAEIRLPEFMHLVRTSVTVPLAGFRNHRTEYVRSVPLESDGKTITLDGIPISGSAELASDEAAIEKIRCRLATMRTVGLPQAWQARCDSCDEMTVEVRLAGRDTTTQHPTYGHWAEILHVLSIGHLVYAGLSRLEMSEGGFRAHYFLIITNSGVERHHFVEWLETETRQPGEYVTEKVSVTLLAYLRTDNLVQTFSEFDPKR